MQHEGERKLVLERVLDEFNAFESAAINIKYQMDHNQRRVMLHLLVHTSPDAFRKLQRIHDSLPPTLSPVTLDALGTSGWILGAVPKGLNFKAEDAGAMPSVGAEKSLKVQWTSALRMTPHAQELLMDRLGLLCMLAARKQRPGVGTRVMCVLDVATFEDESLYMRWCSHGLQQLAMIQKAQAQASESGSADTGLEMASDVKRRALEGAYKETFSGLFMLKEPFEYR